MSGIPGVRLSLCRIFVLLLVALAGRTASTVQAQKVRASQSATKQPSPNIDIESNRHFTFDVFSMRPSKPGTQEFGKGILSNGYQGKGDNMWQTIMWAYHPGPPPTWGNAKLLNAPGWVVDDSYDIEARVAAGDLQAWQNQDRYSPVLLHSALQASLKERCKLALHIVPSEMPYLDLAVGKHGLKIKETAPGEPMPKGGMSLPGGGKITFDQRDGRNQRHFFGATMGEFALMLRSVSRGVPIQDRTGLTGHYDFTWQEQEALDPEQDSGSLLGNWPIDALGLTLRPGKGPSYTFVIDHIEKPTPN